MSPHSKFAKDIGAILTGNSIRDAGHTREGEHMILTQSQSVRPARAELGTCVEVRAEQAADSLQTPGAAKSASWSCAQVSVFN